jgi:large subunit ribosomal protein L5
MSDQQTPETAAVEEEPMAAAETPVEAEPMASTEIPTGEAPMTAAEPGEPAPVGDEETAEQGEPIAEPADTEAAPRGDAPDVEPMPAEASKPEAADAAPAAPKRREKATETPAAERPAGPRGLQLKYRSDVVPALVKQFEYANPNQVPRLEKIVVNVGLGEALSNAKAIDAASGDLTLITGQKPIVMKARRSIAQFRVRTGNPIGLKVTLRGERMWDFLERLTLLTLPRIRDFRGIPGRSFDGRGNYTLGLREQIAFPEIDYDKVDRLRGLEVSIVTTAKSDEESKRLLELLGMPFAS